MVLAVHHVITAAKMTQIVRKVHPTHKATAHLDLIEDFFLIVIPPICNLP
jgi:hypothetical protein